MSEYESLREDIGHVAASLANYSATAVDHLLEQSRQIDKLWADNAALRDDLHALANRVETLTRARLTEPAETAEAMVSPSRWHECECGRTVRRSASDGLIYDDGGLHTCRLDAANVRRMAKEYE